MKTNMKRIGIGALCALVIGATPLVKEGTQIYQNYRAKQEVTQVNKEIERIRERFGQVALDYPTLAVRQITADCSKSKYKARFEVPEGSVQDSSGYWVFPESSVRVPTPLEYIGN